MQRFHLPLKSIFERGVPEQFTMFEVHTFTKVEISWIASETAFSCVS